MSDSIPNNSLTEFNHPSRRRRETAYHRFNHGSDKKKQSFRIKFLKEISINYAANN